MTEDDASCLVTNVFWCNNLYFSASMHFSGYYYFLSFVYNNLQDMRIGVWNAWY